MGIIGRGRPGVDVADLSDDGRAVTVIAPLADFWRSPAEFLRAGGSGRVLNRDEVTVVPPVPPAARVICVGLNYREHISEGRFSASPVPAHPTLFARWPITLTVGGTAVPVPPSEDGLDWEGEVMAWVGTHLSDVTPAEALAGVVGYSTFNDLTARRAQKATSQWTLGKNADHSGPLGPLVPAAEVGDLRTGLRIRTRVNGCVVQDGRTDAMIHSVGDVLSYISRTVSLQPGDLLATGTPAGVGYARSPVSLLTPGDAVEVEIDRLGVLRNTIVGSRAHSRIPSGARTEQK